MANAKKKTPKGYEDLVIRLPFPILNIYEEAAKMAGLSVSDVIGALIALDMAKRTAEQQMEPR